MLDSMDDFPDVFASLAKALQRMGAVLLPSARGDAGRAPRGSAELFELLVRLADTFGNPEPSPGAEAAAAASKDLALARKAPSRFRIASGDSSWSTLDEERAKTDLLTKVEDVGMTISTLSADDGLLQAVISDAEVTVDVALDEYACGDAESSWSRWLSAHAVTVACQTILTLPDDAVAAKEWPALPAWPLSCTPVGLASSSRRDCEFSQSAEPRLDATALQLELGVARGARKCVRRWRGLTKRLLKVYYWERLDAAEAALLSDKDIDDVDVTSPASVHYHRLQFSLSLYTTATDLLTQAGDVGVTISTRTADGDRLKTEYCDSQVLAEELLACFRC